MTALHPQSMVGYNRALDRTGQIPGKLRDKPVPEPSDLGHLSPRFGIDKPIGITTRRHWGKWPNQPSICQVVAPEKGRQHCHALPGHRSVALMCLAIEPDARPWRTLWNIDAGFAQPE